MAVLKINKDNFDSEVMKSDKKVLIDFFANWCGPCRMVGPIVEEIASEHPEFKVCKINVDEEPDLANAFKVMSIPALFVVENGKIVDKAVGAMPKQAILSMLL